MSKLETQINQIYLLRPENRKCSLILYEEALSPALHLFLILSLADMKRRTEASALKSISDIILSDFRRNSRMSAEAMFESTLAQTNQHLADLAHKGHKSWLGKLSAAVLLKSDNQVFLANSGQATIWLKRKAELSEVVPSEKCGLHPLKTFSNFASGRLSEGDVLAALTTSVFNFVSLPLFGKLLKLDPKAAADEISKILLDSSGSDDAFAAFFLEMTAEEKVPVPAQAASPAVAPVSVPARKVNNYEEAGIYAPLPESLREERGSRFKLPSFSFTPSEWFELPRVPRLRLPFRLPDFYRNLTIAGKFFFICFVIFLLLAAANLGVLFVKMQHKKALSTIEDLASSVQQDLSDAESALIYRNQDQAAKLLGDSQAHLAELKKLNPERAAALAPQVDDLSARVTRTNSVTNPRSITDVKLSPALLARAGNGFLFSGSDPKSLSQFDGSYKQLFMLNSVQGSITGLNHIPTLGNFVVSGPKIYQINPAQNQFEQKLEIPGADLSGLKYLDPNRVYTLNRATNQIVRMTVNKGALSAPQSLLKTAVNLSDARDFGMDADIYVLFPAGVRKFKDGKEQSFKLATLPDPLTDATKIFVGSNLYILDASKKRLLIFAKNGTLQNQIMFPSLSSPRDIYVNEQQRVIDILDSEKLVEITF
ncbi:MAG: hypothetical protein ACM3NH_01530 [Candidatus Saccharibacteria bacterium]